MKQPKDYIIFPLDVPTVDEAKAYIRMLSNDIGMFKVGLELFISAGPGIVDFIHNSGDAEVFLDLKLHDIPATVKRAASVVGNLGVKFATVHCGESPKMLEAAVEGCGGKTGILGVTVLTSVNSDDIRQAGYVEKYSDDMQSLVIKRAVMARECGCTGVICSGLEVKGIKEHCGSGFVTVTPGIRPAWDVPSSANDDQQRITTPAQAIQNGSDYIVIGRPIRDADNPLQAAQRVAEEIAGEL